MIPRVIHYCWFGKADMPAGARKCLETWQRFCPRYEIRRWDEDSFDVSACQFSQQAHNSKAWAFVSDYARLKIIYDHGGVYLDTDVELLRTLDDLLHHKAFFGFQTNGQIATGLGFGAEKGNPVVAALAAGYEVIPFLSSTGTPTTTPCPARDAKAFPQFGFRLDGSYQENDGVTLLPADYLCPKSFATGIVSITPRSYAIHHFACSWAESHARMSHIRRHRYCKVFGRSLGLLANRIHSRLWSSRQPPVRP